MTGFAQTQHIHLQYAQHLDTRLREISGRGGRKITGIRTRSGLKECLLDMTGMLYPGHKTCIMTKPDDMSVYTGHEFHKIPTLDEELQKTTGNPIKSGGHKKSRQREK